MAEKHLTDGTTALAAQPRIIKIEAAEKPRNAQLRVAAYTRVSSDSDDQLNSFAAQNRYYAELIPARLNGAWWISMPTRASPAPPPQSGRTSSV